MKGDGRRPWEENSQKTRCTTIELIAVGKSVNLPQEVMISPTDSEMHRTSHSQRHKMWTWKDQKYRQCGRS